MLLNVSVPSQLGTEFSKLCISAGEFPLEGLQQDEEVLRAHSTGSKYLEGTTWHSHYKLSLKCCALADGLVAGEKGVDVLAWLTSEGEHLVHCCQTALLFKG